MAYLVVDKRERYVLPFLRTILDGNQLVEQQIHTGDYVLCKRDEADGSAKVVACFERKTVKDFVSSFKDGRYAAGNSQKEKMLELRKRHGCILFFIVEGPAFCKPTWGCGRGVTYQSILSAMTSLPLAHGIHILQTKNEEHTAQRLKDYINMADGIHTPFAYPSDGVGGAEFVGEVPESVCGKYEITDEGHTVNMWSNLPGISSAGGKAMAEQVSAKDLLARKKEVDDLKSFNGKKLIAKARRSLNALILGDISICAKLLAGLPGISSGMALELLKACSSQHRLQELCDMRVEDLAEVRISQKNGSVRFGKKRAGTVLRILSYPESEPAPPPESAPEPVAPVPDEATLKEIDDMLSSLIS